MNIITTSTAGILETKFLNPFSGHEDSHPIVKISGYDCWLRARSEILVMDGDKIFITTKKHGLCADASESGFSYDVPGGGWQEGETHLASAFREAQEEARLNTKDQMYGGCYTVIRPTAHPWVQEHVPAEYVWRGYFTEVYVATYDGEYTGHIDSRDIDIDMATGEWVNIEDVIGNMCIAHRIAIYKYRLSHWVDTHNFLAKLDSIKNDAETVNKCNSLFADTALRGKEFLVGITASEAAQKVAMVVSKNQKIKENINAVCDDLLSQHTIGGEK